MQIQGIHNNQPNFQALKMTTVTEKAKNGVRNISIYSLNSKDKDFLDRASNVVKSQSFGKDNKLLGGETVREVVDSALNKAKELTKFMMDRVFLAVEDGKKITGIMEVSARGDQRVKGLAVWNNDNLTRKALMLTAMKDTERLSDFALILPSEKSADGIKNFYRGMKFYTPKNEKQLMVEYDKLSTAIQSNEKSMKAGVVHHKSTTNVNLAKILKLDE